MQSTQRSAVSAPPYSYLFSTRSSRPAAAAGTWSSPYSSVSSSVFGGAFRSSMARELGARSVAHRPSSSWWFSTGTTSNGKKASLGSAGFRANAGGWRWRRRWRFRVGLHPMAAAGQTFAAMTSFCYKIGPAKISSKWERTQNETKKIEKITSSTCLSTEFLALDWLLCSLIFWSNANKKTENKKITETGEPKRKELLCWDELRRQATGILDGDSAPTVSDPHTHIKETSRIAKQDSMESRLFYFLLFLPWVACWPDWPQAVPPTSSAWRRTRRRSPPSRGCLTSSGRRLRHGPAEGQWSEVEVAEEEGRKRVGRRGWSGSATRPSEGIRGRRRWCGGSGGVATGGASARACSICEPQAAPSPSGTPAASTSLRPCLLLPRLRRRSDGRVVQTRRERTRNVCCGKTDAAEGRKQGRVIMGHWSMAKPGRMRIANPPTPG